MKISTYNPSTKQFDVRDPLKELLHPKDSQLDAYMKELDEYFVNTSKEQLMADLMKAGVEFYKPNTFFVFPENKKEFLEECMEVADKVWTDELDCAKSALRQPTDKTPEEVLEICLKGKSHYTFIYRAGYGQPDYFETGLSTLDNDPDYFLWVNLGVEQGLEMIERWSLEEWKIS
jgi:hypothetical protein